MTLPTAQVNPTQISKLNTGIQLFTVGAALGCPIFGYTDNILFYSLW